ncbi:NAD(P)H-binding protein [Sphingobium sufflavum]|uniref:NAD(P)-dependent oxidoreductase n=1 Tax=Sphingobium sufflavum TaxID=1129547 RepID=UPI001F32501A|nr:NAD(P)H-binding protein [Sphingobium sufflavum]MCE7796142.1 NAD(P)H-binding protein [Sphingobium sufflavum]
MSIALLGAAGRIGSEIRQEALRRGHDVTAIVRTPGRIEAADGLSEAVADAYDADSIAAALAGQEALISAFSPDPSEPIEGKPERLRQSHAAILAGARKAGVKRVILVGGVGSLWAAPGLLVVDSPEYPQANRGHTLANIEILRGLREEGDDLDWTYVSPPRRIEAGERTGIFRLSKNDLLRDDAGESRISRADFAIAVIDELEKGAHVRGRFTVAY